MSHQNTNLHKGTTLVEFKPTAVLDNEGGNLTGSRVIQNIAAMPQYSQFSPEELRFADYIQSGKLKPSLSGFHRPILKIPTTKPDDTSKAKIQQENSSKSPPYSLGKSGLAGSRWALPDDPFPTEEEL